jgi:hypothetical protein
MQVAFAPFKAAFEKSGAHARGSMELREAPAVFGDLSALGESIARTLGKPEQLLKDRQDAELTPHAQAR